MATPQQHLEGRRLGFGIDRGGTFTDIFVAYPDGRTGTFKLLSVDRLNYSDAPTEAIRRVLSDYTGHELPRGEPIPTDHIDWIRMGTTVATNALLERNGEPMALLVTRGFKDLLHIGNQSRPNIFDFDIQIPETLYEEVVEVDERVILEDPSCKMEIPGRNVRAQNGQLVIVEKELDDESISHSLRPIFARGIRSLAVLLLHSYIWPDHEEAIGRIAEQIGFTNVSLSSRVVPMIKAVPRGFTSCADAYLTPIIQKYISCFRAGFTGALSGVQLEFMQSDGGLCPVESFIGSRAILSGPAGGVVGVSLTAFDAERPVPVIGFDMGGTSTDVSRYAGQFAHAVDSVTAGITIQAPQLEINTVAAGGGSRLFFRDGLFIVGPESAGSHPGPVCYRKGGFLTVTDANLVLGRILPQFFPHIFGKDECQALDKEASMKAFEELTGEINAQLKQKGRSRISMAEAALGFIQVANETMSRPIRRLTEVGTDPGGQIDSFVKAKGFDTSQHLLSCFGGAGGQHACAIARALGIRRVMVHRHAGVLSAYGLVLADVVNEQQEAYMKALNDENFVEIRDRFVHLEESCRQNLLSQGFSPVDIRFKRVLHLRYDRTDCLLMCSPTEKTGGNCVEDFIVTFEEQYQREFGFTVPGRAVIADDIRVRAVGRRYLLKADSERGQRADEPAPRKSITKCTFSEGELDTGVFDFSELRYGHQIVGPAVVIDKNCTVLIEPKCRAEITPEGNLLIHLPDVPGGGVSAELDPIQLSIFSHRFMSIAEQMGSVLQRSAISTNIKERLDFSCALFGPDGGLVANAPHIPVHLGGMQAAVKFQIDHIGLPNFRTGDVILSNTPRAGGSHLPDLTLITPVFFSDQSAVPDFFVANRGHHSDIGGLVPGSMPPHSTTLAQEGAAFHSFKIVDGGLFKETELVEQLMDPQKVPGCSGTRNLRDNLADLNAQIAANQKGIGLLQELVREYSLPVVKAYMAHIQRNAVDAVRQMLKKVAAEERSRQKGQKILKAQDWMDDGTELRLAVEIDEKTGDALFDFTGTGLQVHSSCNAPPAVLMAAVIYCLRCLVGRDIPLNQGCLEPVKVYVPSGTILSPSEDAAVVGGNVLTSQRLCDVILRAFNAVAASQGCMNNVRPSLLSREFLEFSRQVTFGDAQFGYYETVGGGAGAGPGFNGRSGVHSHMTNTRITDVEVLERRYPVIVRKFTLREGSGGDGKFRGGDGISRHLQFRRPVQLSLLTERRVFAPYGLNGGEPAKKGKNTLCRRRGKTRVNLGAKNSAQMEAGDVLELETPGGGGFGERK
uniref:5-oxoprolinase n=1 Tax=Globodera pallida TaxID=36090 RepID=A0A183BQF6_GLOPA